jgi:hypothetical protein
MLEAATSVSGIGVCSPRCLCAGFTAATLQHLQSLLGQAQSSLFEDSTATSQQALVSRIECEALSTLAAKLFDPAGKHKLVAVQEALREFHK